MPKESDFTQEKVTQICEYIEDNKSIRYICKQEGMPQAPTIYEWIRKHDDFAKQYARARETQADVIYEDIIEIECDLVSGKIDPQTARVLIDSHKWRAGKMKPKVYGDNQRVTVDIETLEDRLRKIREAREVTVSQGQIEG